jgi:hypothetical protein
VREEFFYTLHQTILPAFYCQFSMQKNLLFTLFLFAASLANGQQSKPATDSASTKTALAVCNCLSRQDIENTNTENALQQLFLKCMLDSAGEMFSGILDKDDTRAAGEELGKKLAKDLVGVGCSPFLKLAVKMAAAGNEKGAANKDGVKELSKSIEGTVVSVEEKDFLYINVKSKSNRDYRFIYLSYVPGSDDWIKNTQLLRQKKVRVEWAETEVFLPKAKDFSQIRQIKKLTIL